MPVQNLRVDRNVDVLVFDSGVGGLSVLNAIRQKAPKHSFAFVGDNAGLPYGDKSEKWLIDRVPQVIAKALEYVPCKMLVVACNTASTIVLPPLRAMFSFPVIGVVPAIKPAALLSSSKVIGLLATPATVARSYTDTLIEDFAADCQVVRIGSSRLVNLAEEKMRGGAVSLVEIAEILKPFKDASPDVVVLGCTHFPLLKDEFEAVLPGVRFIDSGDAIAGRVLHFQPLGSSRKDYEGASFFTRADIEVEYLKAYGLNEVKLLTL
ncbi:MAG: glutamate racemase [Proteobacteria bacterium]|nr:MAG: glutamate racemase [Pseudomonadota bacterium]